MDLWSSGKRLLLVGEEGVGVGHTLVMGFVSCTEQHPNLSK